MRYSKKIFNDKNETQAISETSAITIVKKEIKIQIKVKKYSKITALILF